MRFFVFHDPTPAIRAAARTGSIVPEGMLVGNSVVSEVYLEERSYRGYDLYIYIGQPSS